MSHTRWLVFAMLGSIVFVGVVMFMDERREFDRALSDLGEQQYALATAVAADFESRWMALHPDLDARDLDDPEATRNLLRRLLGSATVLEQTGWRILLVALADHGIFHLDGRRANAPELAEALRAGQSNLALEREASARLGLPLRHSVAALRRGSPKAPRWSVILVASAQRLRARERHAQKRFITGLTVVTLLVTGFGGLALRDQRRRLEVARELEVASLQREAERLLARMDKLATLAALSSGIAHQIATPLGTILARVEQVAPAVKDLPRATLALEVVSEQVVRIQRIISGLLDMARSRRPTLDVTDPASVAHAALSLVQHRLAAAEISAVFAAQSPALPPIDCDPPLLEQVLVNLLLNACEASPKGSRIRLQLEADEASVRFIVEDEGEGIRAEIAESGGEPFFTTKAGKSGTGLGLAIAQEVVANHGGTLSLKRREGARGTRAVVELPRHQA